MTWKSPIVVVPISDLLLTPTNQESLPMKQPIKCILSKRLSNVASTMHCYNTLLLWMLASTISGCRAEDYGQAFSHLSNVNVNNGEDETYIIIMFSAFLAFCILSVVAMVSYFSFLEDRLMKRYLAEGEEVEATIVSAEFARGGNAVEWGAVKSDRMETEYILFVEYNRTIAEGTYVTTIRKQIKVKECDIIRPKYYTYEVDGVEESAPLESSIEIKKMLQMLHNGNGARGGDGVGRVKMLVLPEHHRSGISKCQAERANTWQSKFSMLALILSAIGLAVFCVQLAANAITTTNINMHQRTSDEISLYMIGIFTILVFIEVLLIHCCLKHSFEETLENEYFNSGELVTTPYYPDEESTLSSGSDFFLGGSPTEFTNMPSLNTQQPGGPWTSTCPIPASDHV